MTSIFHASLQLANINQTRIQLLALPTILFQIEAFDPDDNMDHDTVGLTGSLDFQHSMNVL